VYRYQPRRKISSETDLKSSGINCGMHTNRLPNLNKFIISFALLINVIWSQTLRRTPIHSFGQIRSGSPHFVSAYPKWKIHGPNQNLRCIGLSIPQLFDSNAQWPKICNLQRDLLHGNCRDGFFAWTGNWSILRQRSHPKIDKYSFKM
jgi:hypothetical protein